MQNFVRYIILLVMLSLPVATAAEAVQPVEVTGAEYPDFARIMFHTPSGGAFQVNISGNQLIVTLPNPIQADFHSMLKTLSKQVASASMEQGGHKVVIRLKSADFHPRKLRGQDFFGVDLVKKADEKDKNKDKKTEAAQASKTTEVKKIEVRKPEPVKKEAEKKKEKEKEKAKEKTKEKAKDKTKDKAKPEPKEKTKVAEKKSAKKKSERESEVKTLMQRPDEVVRVMPTQAAKLLTVPWDKLVSAAIYTRGERLWLIFDHLSQVPLSGLPQQYIKHAEQVPDRQTTILKLTLAPEIAKNPDWLWATREQDDWVLYYGKPPVEKPILITTPEDTGENEIKLVVRHTAEPFKMLDPEVGDLLFVVPVRDPGSRVLPGRNFVEFDALPTVQGVVLLRHSDKPDFQVQRDGVSITSKDKLLTSPPVKQVHVSEAPKGALEKKTMYPFATSTNAMDFMPIYYKYLSDIQAAPEATRSELRLKMAQNYFLNEYYAESLGMLRDILVDDPEFAASAGIKPMIAGCLFMMGRYDQSEDAFSNILENKEMPQYAEEQKLWQWASAQMIEQQNLVLLKPKDNFDVVSALNNYLPSYPYPLRRKLLMIYINQLLEESRTGTARKLFKQVMSLGPTQEESEMLDFDEARALIVENKQDVALERLQDVMNNSSSARVRTMALLEYVRLSKDSGKMTLPEAITALEKGRIEWRGDAVEFRLLKQLGQYYIDNKQYKEGLRVWRELVTEFSGTTESLKVASDMANVFADLYDTNGAAYQEPPLEALSTFFEFNELTPVGARGDQISRRLADYLASVDLLENAAAILTHQVRFRSQGEDRAKLALKLIDLHLANDRPDLAKEVLDAMANEKIPEALKPQYHLLDAEMLVQQGKYPEALKALDRDDGQTARDLKLAVYWHQQEWEHVVDILEPAMKARAQKEDTLSPNEEERVLRLAIAYSKLRRFDDLKALKGLYGKRIKNQQIGDAFDFVTDSNAPIDHTALESSLEMNKIQSFLTKYRLPEPPAPKPAPAAPAAPATPPAEGAASSSSGAAPAAPEGEKKPQEKPAAKKE